MQESELAAFQDQLLEALLTCQDVDPVLALHQDASVPKAMVEYIETFDPKMVEVAAELVKKWGQHS